MKLLRLLLSYSSKISTFFENKFFQILKILLPGRFYTIFTALLPLFKLFYRYGKNVHSIIGLLFLGTILEFSLNIRTIIDNLYSIFNISFDMFNKILEKLFNVTIKPNTPTINKIEKTNNKISDYKNKPKNLLNNEEIKEFESLRKYYKKDITEETTSSIVNF